MARREEGAGSCPATDEQRSHQGWIAGRWVLNSGELYLDAGGSARIQGRRGSARRETNHARERLPPRRRSRAPPLSRLRSRHRLRREAIHRALPRAAPTRSPSRPLPTDCRRLTWLAPSRSSMNHDPVRRDGTDHVLAVGLPRPTRGGPVRSYRPTVTYHASSVGRSGGDGMSLHHVDPGRARRW